MNRPPGAYKISSQSRSKLNAFRYSKDAQSPEKTPQTTATTDHTNKENQTSWLNGVVEKQEPESEKNPPAIEVTDSKPIKECPQTPGNRIPLADLISNAEDAFNSAPGQELTPEDYVTWQHVPASSNADPMSQTPALHGKKRRRNLSPTSSPLAATSKSKRRESIDLPNDQSLIRTPQHDLATELWNNYVGKSIANGTGELAQPRFAHLLSSSPQTPVSARTGRGSSGLRRSNSCNAEWPTSKVKRRRVDNERFGTGRSIFSRTRSNVVDSGNNQASNLSTLVKQMEKTLQKVPERSFAPDSSPVPKRGNTSKSHLASPTEGRSPSFSPKKTKHAIVPIGAETAPQTTELVDDLSSDYGDDDFDDDFLELAEASMDPFVDPNPSRDVAEDIQPATSTSMPPNGGAPLLQKRVTFAATSTATSKVDATMTNDNEFELNGDEFDDDFDDFSDNIEDLLAECGKAPSVKLARPIPKGPNVPEQPLSGTGPQRYFASAVGTLNETKKDPDISSGDEFDDGSLDMDAIEHSMRQSGVDGTDHNLRSRQAIKRYLIVEIAESAYSNPRGRVQSEQVLLVQDERAKEDKKVVILRESWFDSPCTKESYIHLIGEFDAMGQCVVDDTANMVILHPDHLVSATIVADSITCQRRAALQERIKNTTDVGKAQVFGNIFHELFQEAIKVNRWDTASLRLLVEDVIVKRIEDLYLIRMTVAEAIEYVMSRVPGVQDWAERFLQPKPSGESIVEDRHNSKLSLSINKLLEVEEHIWSPMYGLKGNIDATVQVACSEQGQDKTLLVPLELKTGNRDTNQAHRAQTALYTLLLSDRYDIDCTFGLLYYLETSKIFRIRGIRHELLQMIQQRNRVVGYMRQRTQLPPMVKKAAFCNKCYSKTACFIYHKLADNGDGETSGLGDDFVKATQHLNPQHQEFFKKWDELLTKEEQSMIRFKRELWTLLSSEREALGRCFGNVVIDPDHTYEDKDGPKINRFRYTFRKKQAPPGFSFTESQLSIGEPIVVSDERGHFALANGYVVQVSAKRITVTVDRKLHGRTRMKGFDAEHNQSFKGIMEILEEGVSSPPVELDEETVYRLDKDEFSNGMAIVRTNLVSMMEKDLFQAKQLRRLIIEGEAPSFKPMESGYTLPGVDKANLNIDQKQAIDKVMSARDYALVLGMPGTGKTTTIAHIIRALVAQGKSVLLTSYTHTAVDNILLKIRDDNFRILRVGAPTKVHPDVQQFADLAAIPKKTIEELKVSYEESQVVATTCLGVSHSIFSQRIFDYCIVDEASQITLPVCLGPIRMARTFILVGDHYQLPPLVQNKEAQDGGLDVSLFKLLSDAHPESVVNLEHQYRMCEDIMLLSNNLIYSGHLKCGTPEVAVRSLEIPNIDGIKQHHHNQIPRSPNPKQICLGTSQGRCWLRDLVDPSAKTRLVNTDTLAAPALDETNGSRIVNPTEAKLCTQLVEAFISCGIPARSIGVITFYRSQLSLLKLNLSRYLPDLEMHTADKFQGRDKEIVILSCVRSNADNHVGDLLRDWRRVNVALTRARTKLLVVGSKSTLRNGNELLGKYVKLVQDRGWIYDLPKNALENHLFESDNYISSTQASSVPGRAATTSSPTKKNFSVSAGAGAGGRKSGVRKPLSPVQARLTPQGLRKPAKKGAKLMSGNKVLGNRPVLQDVVHDLVG